MQGISFSAAREVSCVHCVLIVTHCDTQTVFSSAVFAVGPWSTMTRHMIVSM